MRGLPWRAAICLGIAAGISPLLAGAAAMSSLDFWLMDAAFLWFFAVPTLAHELGVPTADSYVAIVIVYMLQYLFAWWAVDKARALLGRTRPVSAP